MIKGKTKSGFKFEIDERKAQDYRFLRGFSQALKGGEDALKGLDAFEFFVGSIQMDALIIHIAEQNDGICPSDKVILEVTEMVQAASKNS